MTWSLVSEGIVECYQLSNEKNIFTLLKLNMNTGSIRIEADEKRLFFLQPSLRDKMKFKITNEYGYQAGSFTFLERQAGRLVMGDKVYFCSTSNHVMIIYNEKNEVVLQNAVQQQPSSLHLVAMAFASVWTFAQAATSNRNEFVQPAGLVAAHANNS